MSDTIQAPPKKTAICLDISLGSFRDQITRMADFGKARLSSYVCCVNVHMTVEAHHDASFASVVNNADFATPDGMPVLKALNRFNGLEQERVAGNDIMPALMKECEQRGLSVFFYGGKQEVLDLISQRASKDYPSLSIAGSHSPPFRTLTPAEESGIVEMINGSGAHVVMVSLGCPKQEKWMATMKGRIDSIMLGVGGAFLLYAGIDSRAPKWMRDMSLEWLYRLALEPRRLFKRYFVTNSIFIYLFLKKVFVHK